MSIPTKSAWSCISKLLDVIPPSTFNDVSVIPLSLFMASITFNRQYGQARILTLIISCAVQTQYNVTFSITVAATKNLRIRQK